jgi:tRNA(Ile)-lysidine synthase
VIKRFRLFIEEHELCHGGDRMLLAVSGGMDSMAMVDLFHHTNFAYAIAHCNFRLRGEDSDKDEAFVKEIAKNHAVQCYSRSFNTEEIARAEGISIQMAARKLRYEFFEEIASEHGFRHIATAHHLDDQIETFFINLTRGTGIAGLHGIPVEQDKVIRPMMFAYRNEIEAYVKKKGILFREDVSNRSTKYMRNKIRHELIPLFLEMNPAFRSEMTDTMKRLAGTEQIFKQVIELAIREVVTEDKGRYFLDIKKLKMFSPLEHVLYEIVAMFGFKQHDVPNIIKAMDGIPGKIFLSQSYQLVVDREKLIIAGLQQQELSFDILIDEDIKEIRKPLHLTFQKRDAKDFIIPEERHRAALDMDRLHFPLILRKWAKGDAFIPLGMKNRKKLSDFFIDEKISVVDKENTWVITSGDEIAWIIGHRIADPFKITDQTTSVYLISHSELGIHNS